MNDYMKPIIDGELVRMHTSSNSDIRTRGKQLKKAADNVECFSCMDTKKQWDWRESRLAQLDGKGKYDVVNCSGCARGGYIHPTNDVVGYYKKNDETNVENRLDELFLLFLRMEKKEETDRAARISKLHDDWEKNPEPLWSYGANDILRKTSTSLEVHIAAAQLAEMVSKAVQVANGDLLELARSVKDLTLNIDFRSMDVENKRKEVRCNKPDQWGNSTYIVLEYNKTAFSEKVIFCCPLCKYDVAMAELSVQYRIIKPRNKPARQMCNDLMNTEIGELLKTKACAPMELI